MSDSALEPTANGVAHGHAAEGNAFRCLVLSVTAALACGGQQQFPQPPEGHATLSLAVVGSGHVVVMPLGRACYRQCQLRFPRSRRLRLVAESREAGLFGGWSGACDEEPKPRRESTCVFELVGDMSVTADFSYHPYS